MMHMHMGMRGGGGGGGGGMRRGGMRGGMGGPYRGRGGRGGFRGPRIIRRDRRDFNDFPPILNIPERSASPVDTRFLRYTLTKPSVPWAENRLSRLTEDRKHAEGEKAEELQKKILRAQQRQEKKILERKLSKKLKTKEEKRRHRKSRDKHKVKADKKQKLKSKKRIIDNSTEREMEKKLSEVKLKRSEKMKIEEKSKNESKTKKRDKSKEEKHTSKDDTSKNKNEKVSKEEKMKKKNEKNKKIDKPDKEISKKESYKKEKKKKDQKINDKDVESDEESKKKNIDLVKIKPIEIEDEGIVEAKSDNKQVDEEQIDEQSLTPNISFTPERNDVMETPKVSAQVIEDEDNDDDDESTSQKSDRELSQTPPLPETPTSPVLSRFGTVDIPTPPPSTPKIIPSMNDNSDSDPTPIIDPMNVTYEMKSPATTPIIIVKPRAVYASPKSNEKIAENKPNLINISPTNIETEVSNKDIKVTMIKTIENEKSEKPAKSETAKVKKEVTPDYSSEDESSDVESSLEDTTSEDEDEDDDEYLSDSNNEIEEENPTSSSTSPIIFDENIVIKQENQSPDESNINVGQIEQLMDVQSIKIEEVEEELPISPDSDEYTSNWEDDLSNNSFDKLCSDIEKHKSLVQVKEKESKDQTLNNEYEQFLKVLEVENAEKDAKAKKLAIDAANVTNVVKTKELSVDLEIPTKTVLENDPLIPPDTIVNDAIRSRSNSSSSTTSSSSSSSSDSSSNSTSSSSSSTTSTDSSKERDAKLKLLKGNQNESIRNTIIAKIMEMIPDNSDGGDKIIDPDKMKEEILKIIEAEALEKEQEQKPKITLKIEPKTIKLNTSLTDNDDDFTDALVPKTPEKLVTNAAVPIVSSKDSEIKKGIAQKSISKSPTHVKRRGPRTPSPRTPERSRYRSNSRSRKERTRPSSRLTNRRKSHSPMSRGNRKSRSPIPPRGRRYRSPTPPPNRRRNCRSPQPEKERWNDSQSYSDENSLSYDNRPPSPHKDNTFQQYADMSLSSSSWTTESANQYMSNASYNNLQPAHTFPESPRRIPLDDRIEIVLGQPIQQSPSQFYANYMPPERNYQPQDYANFNAYYPEYQNPPVFTQNQPNVNSFPNMFNQPPPMNAGQPAINAAQSPSVIPPLKKKPVTFINEQNMHTQQQKAAVAVLKSTNPYIRQVGNVLEIIPTETADMTVPPPPLPRKFELKPPEPSSIPSASNAEILKNEKELKKLNKILRKEKLRLELAKLVTLAEDINLDDEKIEEHELEQSLKVIKINDPPEKGILKAEEKDELVLKKKVMFQDGVEPGHGTSTTDDETGPSLAKAKKLKKRKMKILQKNKENMELLQEKNIAENTFQNNFEPLIPVDDNLPPPSPPPGSPPANYIQPRIKNPPPPEYLYFHLDPNANRLIVTRYCPGMQMQRLNNDNNQPMPIQSIMNMGQRLLPFDNRLQLQRHTLSLNVQLPRDPASPRFLAVPSQIPVLNQESMNEGLEREENILKFSHPPPVSH